MNRSCNLYCLLCIIILLIVMSCRKPYNPPAISSPGSYLVVEGGITSGSDSTIIKLSKTVNLSNKIISNPVLSALLTVESDHGDIFPLTETTNGHYVSAGLNLDNSRKYRLRIKTAGNKEYLSDFVAVENAPAIDTVSYSVQNNGASISVSTHDPQNSTHYYRWDYRETWIIHSKYYSFYKSNGDTVTERDFNTDEIYQCWQSDTSSSINLGSSANLKNDIIVNNPVTFVPSTSEKLGGNHSILLSQNNPANSAYSIVVMQHALTSSAYTFWVNLKKNTEQLGSIFDAQPSQINGNIHSTTNPAEPVIGYLSAGSVASKRIFVTNQQIPGNWASGAANDYCKIDSLYFYFIPHGGVVAINQENEFFNYNKGARYNGVQIPVVAIFNRQLGTIIGHTGAAPECVDCTLRGTNKQPTFWK
jgi:hypothetical protein